ncbi:YkgJ family cysteine cluster protein [uncultured Paludibaculum sp.]|uniref:YkgJ family cysteine cluster protein n=1 Tax=uncultured Paludibaculum sp. TaxID=1765020 RepID=UPI002AAB0AA4|nr:YkgJ family cysteine cluster protein [uncultured Paludibaculum sp.]
MPRGNAATELVQIIDRTMAEAERRSGSWVVCRPGCSECCQGVFAISRNDAERLRHGLEELSTNDPVRAARVRQRARDSIARLSATFPGDPVSGILDSSPQARERFETFGDDEPCPALDPTSQTCDLYLYRPATCRTFGPAIRFPEGEIRCCELCYQNATENEIAEAATPVDRRHLEELRNAHTIAAYPLSGDCLK